jgi:hypothetical protein
MTHEEKLRRMGQHLPKLGIAEAMFAPPAYKLLWKLGLKVAPPVFAGPLHCFLMGFIAITLMMALLGWLVPLPFEARMQREFGFWAVPLAMGVLGGLMSMVWLPYQFKRYRLPSWDEYRGE